MVNVDDLHGRLLAGTAGVATVTTGTAADADWRATEVAASLEGTSFRLRSPAGSRPVRLRLAGRFNVANALGALAAADAVGIDLDTAVGRAGGAWPGCPAASSGSTPASRSPCWSTTPTPPTRSTTCSGRPGRSPADG